MQSGKQTSDAIFCACELGLIISSKPQKIWSMEQQKEILREAL